MITVPSPVPQPPSHTPSLSPLSVNMDSAAALCQAVYHTAGTALISASITSPGRVAAACRWQGSGSSKSPWSLERCPSAIVCHQGQGCTSTWKPLCAHRERQALLGPSGAAADLPSARPAQPHGSSDAFPAPSLQLSPHLCVLAASPSNCHTSNPDLTGFIVSIAQPTCWGGDSRAHGLSQGSQSVLGTAF